MINRLIFVTGLVLLCFSIASGIFLLQLLHSSHPTFQMIPLPQPAPIPNTCAGGCSGGPAPTISSQGPSWLAIVGELPKQMDSGISDTIEVKLTLSTPEGPEHYPSSNNVRTILHPDISQSLDNDVANSCSLLSEQESITCLNNPPSMGSLFGPGYELFASAHLVATGFDIQLLDATEQSTDQFVIGWDWNIFPKSAGNQPVDLNVDLHWKAVGKNGKEDVFRQIWEANPTITVNPPPLITSGQLTISGAVSAFFGLIFAGVSGPMILGELKKRYEGKQRERGEQEKRALLEQELEQERTAREQAERKLSKQEHLRQERLRRERSRRGGSL